MWLNYWTTRLQTEYAKRSVSRHQYVMREHPGLALLTSEQPHFALGRPGRGLILVLVYVFSVIVAVGITTADQSRFVFFLV